MGSSVICARRNAIVTTRKSCDDHEILMRGGGTEKSSLPCNIEANAGFIYLERLPLARCSLSAKGRPESDAVDAWVRETLPRAVAYARSLLRDLPAAEDVAHDCYCRLLRRADIYDLPRDGT